MFIPQTKNATWASLVVLFLLLAVPLSVRPAFARSYTIGIITYVTIHDEAADGFKEGMAELGYIDGKDVRYIHYGSTETEEQTDVAIRDMLSQDVDLILTAGNFVTLRVKAAVEGTDIPVLLTTSIRPVEDGLVKSLGYPGGNITGVRAPDTALKTLEWLLKIFPSCKKVFIPFNTNDQISHLTLNNLFEKAKKLGIELTLLELSSVEEAITAIEHLPEEIDAVLRIPSPTLDMRNSELSQAAIRRRIPMVASLPLDDAVLLSCSTSIFTAGKQNARLAHLIFNGAKPSDLPVETADPALTINLDTAEKIGVYIPDEILIQAKTILR